MPTNAAELSTVPLKCHAQIPRNEERAKSTNQHCPTRLHVDQILGINQGLALRHGRIAHQVHEAQDAEEKGQVGRSLEKSVALASTKGNRTIQHW